MFLSRPGFFRRGVTGANLNISGKEPWDIDRLEIISENTVKQDLIRDVGMKSIEDDLMWRLIDEFKNFGWGDRRKCVKWSDSEWKIGNIGRVKEGWDFAINGIFDGADLGDEKVMHNLVLSIGSCQVTVRRVKAFLCESPLLSRVGAITEPSVEVHTPWLINESVCETTSTMVVDTFTFTACGLLSQTCDVPALQWSPRQKITSWSALMDDKRTTTFEVGSRL